MEIFSLVQNKKKDGWLVIPTFSIVAAINPANFKMLLAIQTFFGNIGHILVNKNVYQYRVMGLKNCLIIRSHFINYPLMTYKLVFYKLWSEVLDLMIKN